MPEPGSTADTQAKQAMLVQLAAALSALGSKMRAQQEAAVDLCALGARAEEMARSARKLAFSPHHGAHAGLRSLSENLDGLAEEMRTTAERVEQECLLGRAVAEALSRHSAELNALAQQDGRPQDMATIRARLRPLATTLEELPSRMKAGKARTADIAALAARAREIAGQATELLSGNLPGRQEQMLALARGLGQLAEEAVQVSARYAEDANVAVQVAEEMAGRATNLSRRPVPDGGLPSLSALISAGHALAERAGTGDPPANPVAAMNWEYGRSAIAATNRTAPAALRRRV